MKKILLAGITGQDGSYLAELLLEKGCEVHGIIRRSSSFNTQRIEHIYDNPNLILHYGDMTDSLSLDSIMFKVKPDEIYNLAAQSHVGTSFFIPEYTGQVDGLGTLKLLEAMRKHVPKSKFYNAATSELFGRVLETPQTEKTPFNPVSPYGIAKQYAFNICKNYRESYGMFISNGILFNHESERRGETFVTRKITIGLSKWVKGGPAVELGNLDSKRDWGYAADYVEGMYLMLQHNTPDDFILATNETHTIREFINEACKYINYSTVKIEPVWKGSGTDEVLVDNISGRIIIKINPKYFRPTDVDLLLGDATKVEETLGWKPKVTFYELVKKMMKFDIER
jgi:GDPmannose 4,6-dehydratase